MGLSPMMEHYLKLKEQHKDCIIFYRLGDFYEMFFDDAIKASSLLELTLTGRDCGLKERAPMCGIPYHAADMYIDKLVSMGEKVAICEQLSAPNKKELVKRDVIRIITAGTVTNSDYMDDKKNNFIASVYSDGKNYALSWADITTGEFFVKDLSSSLDELFNLLVKINPAEIIASIEAFNILTNSPLVTKKVLPYPQCFAESEFSFFSAENTLKNQLKLSSLSSLALESNSPVCASGGLVSYLKETQKIALENINSLVNENEKKCLMLDFNAVRNLELLRTNRDGKKHGTLLWLLDKTKTSMGARKLQSWILSPLINREEIEYRLSAVSDLYNDTLIRQSLSELLAVVKDVGRLSGKISNGNLVPIDCIALCRSLEILPTLKFRLSGLKSKYINDLADSFPDFSDVVKLLQNAIYDENEERGEKIGDAQKKNKKARIIKSGYNKELDEYRYLCEHGKNAIAMLQTKERERTGIKNLKISYNRVFGYNIEITNSFLDKVPFDYIRRQTLVGAERFITDELKELEAKLLGAEESAENLENSIFNEIKKTLSKRIADIQKTSNSLAELDVLVCFATVARERAYVKPQIKNLGESYEIIDGRHPVVEAVSKGRFISNNVKLDKDENRTLIITGPNMAGKSTYMRQVALISIMAQIGCFVPAKSASVPIVDKIFTRIGASDSLVFDQSTFMVEMSETADIINNATENSLIILDEIGRGTSTYDGLSIAWAVLEYCNEKIKAKTLFATHYHELTKLEGELSGVKNYKISVKELAGSIVFTRKIERGAANKSFGIEVAELAGVNKEVTKKAKDILSGLEKKENTNHINNFNTPSQENTFSEVEAIIKDVDINNLTPIQAFQILTDLHEKLRAENEQN